MCCRTRSDSAIGCQVCAVIARAPEADGGGVVVGSVVVDDGSGGGGDVAAAAAATAPHDVVGGNSCSRREQQVARGVAVTQKTNCESRAAKKENKLEAKRVGLCV